MMAPPEALWVVSEKREGSEPAWQVSPIKDRCGNDQVLGVFLLALEWDPLL